MDKEIAAVGAKAVEQETAMRKKAGSIGNIVHESVPVSSTEVRLEFTYRSRQRTCSPSFDSLLFSASQQDDNKVERTFYPKDPNGESAPPVKGGGLHMKEGVLSHHEVMHRLDILEMERGEIIILLPSMWFRHLLIPGLGGRA